MRKVTVALSFAALAAITVDPAAAAPADRTRPGVGFTTPDGAVRVSGGTGSELSATEGWVRDDASGVRRVTVTYCPGSKGEDGSWTCGSTGTVGTPTTTRAVLTCDRPRRSCSWSAAVPTQPGRYLVFAEASDRAGHRRVVGPIEVVVA